MARLPVVERAVLNDVNQLFGVSQDEVTTLDGHLGEVFVCAWNPKERRSVSQWQRRRDGENLDITGWTRRREVSRGEDETHLWVLEHTKKIKKRKRRKTRIKTERIIKRIRTE